VSVRRQATRATLFSLLSLLAGCGAESTSHVLAAKNYDRTCTSVADCFPVYEGPVVCGVGGCPNAAIRQDALAKYTVDFHRASVCPANHPPFDGDTGGPSCPEGRVACENAVCQLEVQASDAGSEE
jgi:hypothetical protein